MTRVHQSLAGADRQRPLRLLEELVNTDSATRNTAGVNRTARILAGELSRMGFSVDEVPGDAPFGNQVIGKLGAPPFEALLVGHMDTALPAGSAERHPFRSEGDRCFGVGVLDMKGGLVCAVSAIEALITSYPGVGGVAVLFNSDEEDGSPFSRKLLKELVDESRRAFILEPASDRQSLVGGRKAVGIFEVAVSGIAAHAGSEPEDGASAVHDLVSRAVRCIGLANHDAGTTVNLGVFSGGTEPYVVAERATMRLDVRAVTREEMDRIDKGLRELPDLEVVPGTTCTVTGGFHRPPMERTDANLELFQVAREAGKAIGLDLRVDDRGGASDGNLTSAWGLPTLDGLGPSGTGAHSDREHIHTETLYERTALLALILERLVV